MHGAGTLWSCMFTLVSIFRCLTVQLCRFFFRQTKALLTPEKLMAFVDEKIKTLGTAACPPYHLAIVVGGLSAEMTLKTVKLASTKYLDNLPTVGNEHGHAFRDAELEQKVSRNRKRAFFYLFVL